MLVDSQSHIQQIHVSLTVSSSFSDDVAMVFWVHFHLNIVHGSQLKRKCEVGRVREGECEGRESGVSGEGEVDVLEKGKRGKRRGRAGRVCVWEGFMGGFV